MVVIAREATAFFLLRIGRICDFISSQSLVNLAHGRLVAAEGLRVLGAITPVAHVNRCCGIFPF